MKLLRPFRPRPGIRARALSRLRFVELERRDIPAAGPLGPLQPPALSFTYATAASGLPLLHSLPGARAAVFLDFDGHGSNTPYDTDGSSATFGSTERAVIVEAWRQMSIYFAIFEVDMTTEQPAAGTPFAWQLISNSIVGGVATVGAFPNTAPRGFNQSSDARTRQSGIAHETGHNFGLWHQSDFDLLGNLVNEYSSGPDVLHGPLMGVDYARNVHKWIIGHPDNSPSVVQDDIAVIANEIRTTPTPAGDGFRADDHGNATGTATAVDVIGGVQYGWGVVERPADVDAFTFSITGGTYTVAAIPNTPSGVDLKMEVYGSGGTLVAAADGSTNDQQLVMTLPAGSYTVFLSSHGDYGDLGAYYFTVRPFAAGWDTRNINTVTDAGHAGYDAATGTFTVGGSGSDIGGTADGFRFVYQPLTGDGSITARVVSLENTDPAAKAGVMIRESLDPGARTALAAVTAETGVVYRRRTTDNASANTTTTAGLSAPYWVRLVRAGNSFTAFRSSDGITWTPVGSAVTISMGQAVYVGLAVTSRDNGQADPLAEGVFADVTLTGTTGTPPPTYNALPAPANLSVALGTGNGLTLTWESVPGATGYAVDRSLDNVNWSRIATTGVTTTYTDPNPGEAQRYFYRVSARDAAGQSVPSEVRSSVNRPAAPTGLTVTSWQAARLILNWDDVSGDTGYRIERSPDGGTTWTAIGTVAINVPSYTDTGLATFTTYAYRVTPLSPLGDGVASAVGTGYTRMAAVAGLRFTDVAATQAVLQWDPVSGASSYRVERSTDNVSFTGVATGLTGTTYTSTGLTPLAEYYYRVTAVNAFTESDGIVRVFTATSATTPLPAPWSATDIGTVGGQGAAGQANGTFTIVGSGNDIAGTADGFRFVYQTLSGDGSITARVAAQENTADRAKAGVMIREALAAGSKHALMAVTAGNGASFQRRTSTNGSSTNTSSAGPDAPYWVRLVRSGNTLTGYSSSDGVTWTQVGTATVSMTQAVYIGLAVSSGDNTELNTSTFDNVTVTGTAPPVQVQSAAINDGAAQRSMVNSITITFSGLVTFTGTPAAAFQLRQAGGTTNVGVAVDLSGSTATQTIARLTFSGPFTEGLASALSLMDGNYTLTVLSAQVSGGLAGGDSATVLHRLFGDFNADRTVNGADFAAFRAVFGANPPSPSLLAAFDFNGDGAVNGLDFAAFRAKFGTILS